MLVESHAKRQISWPEGRRMTVAITFDFQGGEPVRPLPNDSRVPPAASGTEHRPDDPPSVSWDRLPPIEK